MAHIVSRGVLALAVSGFTLGACGGKDDTADSGGDTDATGTGTGATGTGTGATGTGTGATGTGTGATGTGTGTTAPPAGLVRAVDLMSEFDAINILSNGNSIKDDFPRYGNTDADGLAWVPFPPATYEVGAEDASDDTLLVTRTGVVVAVDQHYTVIYRGSANLDALYPGMGFELAIDVIDDPPRTASAGSHSLNIYHYNPFIDGGTVPVNVMVGGNTYPLAYTESSGAVTLPSGATTFELDWNGDMVADATYAGSLADADWSNVYLVPFDANLDLIPESFLLLHHAYSTDNTPLLPM